MHQARQSWAARLKSRLCRDAEGVAAISPGSHSAARDCRPAAHPATPAGVAASGAANPPGSTDGFGLAFRTRRWRCADRRLMALTPPGSPQFIRSFSYSPPLASFLLEIGPRVLLPLIAHQCLGPLDAQPCEAISSGDGWSPADVPDASRVRPFPPVCAHRCGSPCVAQRCGARNSYAHMTTTIGPAPPTKRRWPVVGMRLKTLLIGGFVWENRRLLTDGRSWGLGDWHATRPVVPYPVPLLPCSPAPPAPLLPCSPAHLLTLRWGGCSGGGFAAPSSAARSRGRHAAGTGLLLGRRGRRRGGRCYGRPACEYFDGGRCCRRSATAGWGVPGWGSI